jgi:IS5 family transposase
LYLKALRILMRQAKRHGVILRRSHARVAKRAALMAGRYAHAKQFKRMRAVIKKLKAFLGRMHRDICRKTAGNAGIEARVARLLGLIEPLVRTAIPPTFLPHCHEPTGSV